MKWTAGWAGRGKGKWLAGGLLLGGAGLAAVLLAWRVWPEAGLPGPALSEPAFAASYDAPLPPIAGRPRVYFLGHSLIGRDMPAMLGQLGGNDWNSQLGWGASLDNHWTGQIPGFAEENLPPVWRPAGEAADSGDYPVVVLTEMVELKDALRHHDSARALGDWAKRFRQGRPDVRIYLYETWHQLDDPGDWLGRIDADWAALWQAGLLRRAMALPGVGTIYMIPGGQVLAAASRAAAAGQLPGLRGVEDFLADDIHLTDLGNRLIALTHYAVIYGRKPEHLRRDLTLADGKPATAVTPETQAALEELVWQVVSSYRETGVSSSLVPAGTD